MTTTEHRVEGMTCEHCVRAVQEEVGALAGVIGVEVELEGGRLVVTADAPVERADLAAAVDEAGYRLVDGDAP